MKKKHVFAILADFPAVWIDPSFANQGWHHAPAWLANIRDFFAANEEFEVHWIIFSPFVRLSGYQKYQRWGQTFHVLPRYSLKWDQRFRYRYARWAAGRILKKIKPDIVHSWGTEAEYAAAALGQKCVKILSMQGIIFAYLQRSQMGEHFHKQEKYEIEALKFFDIITSESVWGCDRVREIVPEKPIMRWEYAPEGSCFEQKWTPAETPCCVLAGTDTPTKNIAAAIQAFSSPELSHVTLYMAGAEPEKHPNLPPNIIALGGIPRTELFKYLCKAWCFVHPSLADTSPNVVKEARVIGLPVVVSEETGGTQYVVHGESGFIFNPHDVEALKQGVCAVLKDRDNAMRMGHYQHEECRRALSAETMRTRMMEIYHHALELREKG